MRRAQAALEFLVTYGWAIMIILVMIGAIGYFGVLNTDRLIPESCNIGAEFSCDDFIVRADSSAARSEVSISVTNLLGKTVDVDPAHIECLSGCQDGYSVGDGNCGLFATGGPDTAPWTGNTQTVNSGKQFFYVCNPGAGRSIRPIDPDATVRIRFAFNYSLQGSSIKHLVQGDITARPME